MGDDTEDGGARLDCNWLEIARNYHSIASRSDYHKPRESEYHKKVTGYGTKPFIRSTYRVAARNAPSYNFAGRHPERNLRVGRNQSMCSEA